MPITLLGISSRRPRSTNELVRNGADATSRRRTPREAGRLAEDECTPSWEWDMSRLLNGLLRVFFGLATVAGLTAVGVGRLAPSDNGELKMLGPSWVAISGQWSPWAGKSPLFLDPET